MRAIVGLTLVAESALTALWLTGLLPTLAVYDGLTLALIVLRVIVALVEFAAGVMLLRRQAPGPLFARGALLVSAPLLTAEIGFRLTPSNLFPDYRWPVVAAYWVYAVVALLAVSLDRQHNLPNNLA
jgi:hypothetical protein